MKLRKQQSGDLGDLLHSLAVGALIFCGAFFSVSTTSVIWPEAQTRYFPVVGNTDIANVRETQGGVIFSAQAEKYRDCTWIRTEWFLGERGGPSVLLTSTPHQDPTKIRPMGVLSWDELFVPVSSEATLRQGTYADTIHHCLGGAPVRSRFWR